MVESPREKKIVVEWNHSWTNFHLYTQTLIIVIMMFNKILLVFCLISLTNITMNVNNTLKEVENEVLQRSNTTRKVPSFLKEYHQQALNSIKIN